MMPVAENKNPSNVSTRNRQNQHDNSSLPQALPKSANQILARFVPPNSTLIPSYSKPQLDTPSASDIETRPTKRHMDAQRRDGDNLDQMSPESSMFTPHSLSADAADHPRSLPPAAAAILARFARPIAAAAAWPTPSDSQEVLPRHRAPSDGSRPATDSDQDQGRSPPPAETPPASPPPAETSPRPPRGGPPALPTSTTASSPAPPLAPPGPPPPPPPPPPGMLSAGELFFHVRLEPDLAGGGGGGGGGSGGGGGGGGVLHVFLDGGEDVFAHDPAAGESIGSPVAGPRPGLVAGPARRTGPIAALERIWGRGSERRSRD